MILLNLFQFLLFNVVASKNVIALKDDCGSFFYAAQAVLNGEVVNRNEFPFLFPIVTKIDITKPFCSGNIISKNVALTGKNAIFF